MKTIMSNRDRITNLLNLFYKVFPLDIVINFESRVIKYYDELESIVHLDQRSIPKYKRIFRDIDIFREKRNYIIIVMRNLLAIDSAIISTINTDMYKELVSIKVKFIEDFGNYYSLNSNTSSMYCVSEFINFTRIIDNFSCMDHFKNDDSKLARKYNSDISELKDAINIYCTILKQCQCTGVIIHSNPDAIIDTDIINFKTFTIILEELLERELQHILSFNKINIRINDIDRNET